MSSQETAEGIPHVRPCFCSTNRTIFRRSSAFPLNRSSTQSTNISESPHAVGYVVPNAPLRILRQLPLSTGHYLSRLSCLHERFSRWGLSIHRAMPRQGVPRFYLAGKSSCPLPEWFRRVPRWQYIRRSAPEMYVLASRDNGQRQYLKQTDFSQANLCSNVSHTTSLSLFMSPSFILLCVLYHNFFEMNYMIFSAKKMYHISTVAGNPLQKVIKKRYVQ